MTEVPKPDPVKVLTSQAPAEQGLPDLRKQAQRDIREAWRQNPQYLQSTYKWECIVQEQLTPNLETFIFTYCSQDTGQRYRNKIGKVLGNIRLLKQFPECSNLFL